MTRMQKHQGMPQGGLWLIKMCILLKQHELLTSKIFILNQVTSIALPGCFSGGAIHDEGFFARQLEFENFEHKLEVF